MGVKNLSALFDESSIDIRIEKKISDFKDKYLALDAFNVLFQFLASIRDQTGQSMSDGEGRITSHLIGVLTRNCNLLQEGVTPVYVFDGESHELKSQVQKERRQKREIAAQEYEKAIEEGDMARARSFAQRMNKLSSDMIEDAKTLLEVMGIPVIQAPGEGEAQAAQLAKEGKVFGTASQDYDSIMFGSPYMIRNLNTTGKRTLPGGRVITISPEEIELKQVLTGLGITHDQLIDLGILLGSDFNPDGISGIGPKTAFRLINKHGSFKEIERNEVKVKQAEIPYEIIFEIFKKPNVNQKMSIENTSSFDAEKILDFLVVERGFNEGRYKNLLMKTQRLIIEREEQTDLDGWF